MSLASILGRCIANFFGRFLTLPDFDENTEKYPFQGPCKFSRIPGKNLARLAGVMGILVGDPAGSCRRPSRVLQTQDVNKMVALDEPCLGRKRASSMWEYAINAESAPDPFESNKISIFYLTRKGSGQASDSNSIPMPCLTHRACKHFHIRQSDIHTIP